MAQEYNAEDASQLSDVGDKARETADRVTSPARTAVKKGVNKAAKKGVEKGTKAAGKAAKKGAKAGAKATEKAAQATAKGVSSLTAKISAAVAGSGTFFLGAIAIILVLAIVISVIAIFISKQESNTESRYTDECEKIIKMFDNYVEYGSRNDGTGSHSKYSALLTSIKSNDYQAELAAIWKVVAYENASRYAGDVFAGNEYGMDEGGNQITPQDHCYDTYTAYYDFDVEAGGSYDTFNLPTCYSSDGSMNWGEYREAYNNMQSASYGNRIQFHYYFTNCMMRLAMDSFQNYESNGNIKSVESAAKDIAKKKNISSASDKYAECQTEAYTQQLELIYKSFCSRVNTDKYKCFSIKNEYNAVEILNVRDTFKSAVTGDKSEDMYSDINSWASSYRITGDDVTQLALSEVGNKGQKYCDYVYNGNLTEWCAIFCKYLMVKCNVKPEDYGWSAAVPTWVSQAEAKGKFHSSTSGYTPKVGDFFIEGLDYHHCGIIVAINGINLTTVEGNTAHNDCSQSVVSKYTYHTTQNASDVSGYIEMTYPASGGGIVGEGMEDLYKLHYDGKYTPKKYSLTTEEKNYLAKVIMGEFGTDYVGCCMIAQCMRDAFIDNSSLNPMNVGKLSSQGGLGYTGFNSNPNQYCYDAIKFIFEQGNCVMHHRLLYMATKSYVDSNPGCWHSTQNFMVEYKGVYFYDRRY